MNATDCQPQQRSVVMIVDNAIDGDSRVQKTAQSMAERGWKVTLIGRSPNGVKQEYELGQAQVIRLPMPYHLHAYRRKVPGRSLRWPLAYRSIELANYRSAQNAFRTAALRHRKAELALSKQSGGSRFRILMGTLILVVRRLMTKIPRTWHLIRNVELRRAVKARKAPTHFIDNLAAKVSHRFHGRHSWPLLEPLLADYEVVYGPVIEKIRPDIIHAHDFRMVGVGVRAAEIARSVGRGTRVVYDAHEFMPGVRAQSLRWQLANEAHELAFAHRADAVVTVSSTLATMLRERHKLQDQPTIVLNAPDVVPSSTAPTGGIRAACNLTPSDTLIVYSGSAAPQRGLRTIVEALPHLPLNVHAALVVSSRSAHIMSLEKLATDLGVADRLHIQPYVPHDEVVSHLASADVGLIPIHHFPNHEIALITKFFEYAHAGLPILVSDVKTMSETVREIQNGEVFEAENVESFVSELKKIIAQPGNYRRAYTKELLADWSWQKQAETLDALYHNLASQAVGEDV